MPRRFLDPALFTDEKLANATLQERLLFTALIANQDDDGRLLAHPGYLRSIAFPYDDFAIEQVKEMRDHLAQVNSNVIVYENSGHEYIQLKRHSRYQRPRYYHPSKLPAPLGWPFNDSNHSVTTESPRNNQTVTAQHTEGEGKGKGLDKGLDRDKTKIGRGEATSTKQQLKSPLPTASTSLIELNSIFQVLIDTHHEGWGRIPDSRETAQLRDLAKEISSAGGATAQQVQDAFREAAGQNKYHISYVRAILLDWLGVERSRSP